MRRLHSKLFYRPLLDSIASYDAEALSLSPQAMERQLGALGFASPRNALGHLRALAGQNNRRGRIQALLLPTFMEWLADTPDPDAGLLAYRRLCEENEEITGSCAPCVTTASWRVASSGSWEPPRSSPSCSCATPR